MKITCSKCGGFLELTRIYVQRYCAPCHAEWTRANRPEYKDLSPIEQKKVRCRKSSSLMVRRGKLTPQPCEKCGNAKAEKHHEDYDKPEQVNWLCRGCHVDLHTKRNRSEALGVQG